MEKPVSFQHFEVPRREDGSLHELGRGAMGITYKAYDTSLQTFVALKVVNAALLKDDVAQQRFMREARAAAKLRHPNVASVFHLGQQDGSYFYAMEFVEGETVESLMKREGTLPPATALQIVLQVARALGAAEKQGLVHRDIKPANLMIVPEDDGPFTVKVIDFGLAKNVSGGEEAATHTLAGFLGTPHFASPEQLDERELDVRSDIYSLGVTLFYMLVGKAPFSGSMAQIMSQHLYREPPMEKLATQPPAVVDLVRRLAKDPAERPQTAAELRREVESCLGELAVVPLPQTEPPAALPQPQEEPPDPENFETAVLEEMPPGPVQQDPATGVVLAFRYRLLQEMPEVRPGRAFRAESLETGEPVAILILDRAQLSSGHAYTFLENQVARLAHVKAPSVRKVYSFEHLEGLSFLALEWVEGPTLLDLLRVRRALSLDEALPMLRGIAEGFDALLAAGLPCPDAPAHEILLVDGKSQSLADAQTALPIAKFSPIALARQHSEEDASATRVTSSFSLLQQSGAFAGNEGAAFAYALASLAYDLLGGVRSGTTVPIPGLSEAANSALRRALGSDSPFLTASGFLDAMDGSLVLDEPELPQSYEEAAPAPIIAPPILTVGVELTGNKKGFRLSPIVPIVAATGLLVLAAGGAGIWLNRPVLPLPTPTPAPIATTTPVPVPSATSRIAPTPEPTPDTLKQALHEVQMSSASEPAAALEKLLDLLKNNPARSSEIRPSIETQLEALRTKLKGKPTGEISVFRQLLEAAAGAEFPTANLLLGQMIFPSDPSLAFKYFTAAADKEYPPAMASVGQMWASGQGAPSTDLAVAAQWFAKGAKLGDPRSLQAFGECLLYGRGVDKDKKQAVVMLEQAAAKNNPQAMNILGDLYKKGEAGLTPNPTEAFNLFLSAKELGFLDAQANLGVLHMTGTGTPKDEQAAYKLFLDGAQKQNAPCMFYLAQTLGGGTTIPADPRNAREWYLRAAQAGYPPALDWCKKNNVTVTTSVGIPR